MSVNVVIVEWRRCVLKLAGDELAAELMRNLWDLPVSRAAR